MLLNVKIGSGLRFFAMSLRFKIKFPRGNISLIKIKKKWQDEFIFIIVEVMVLAMIRPKLWWSKDKIGNFGASP